MHARRRTDTEALVQRSIQIDTGGRRRDGDANTETHIPRQKDIDAYAEIQRQRHRNRDAETNTHKQRRKYREANTKTDI